MHGTIFKTSTAEFIHQRQLVFKHEEICSDYSYIVQFELGISTPIYREAQSRTRLMGHCFNKLNGTCQKTIIYRITEVANMNG